LRVPSFSVEWGPLSAGQIETMTRFGIGIFAASFTAAAMAVGSVPAQARTHVFLGFNFYAPAPWYYAPPRVYYVAPPPPVYYPLPPPTAFSYPPPVTYAPAPAPAPFGREYSGDATIDGSGQPFYGAACLEADGRWHILR